MDRWQVEKIHEIGVLEDGLGGGVKFSHQRCEFWRRENGAFEERSIELAFELAARPFFPDREPEVKFPFLGTFATGEDQEILGPRQLCQQC